MARACWLRAAKLTLSVRLWHTVLVRRVVVDNEQIINDYEA